MAAVQMLAALVHIHSIALSRATVHRQAHKHSYALTHTHSCLGSRERKKILNHTIFLEMLECNEENRMAKNYIL